MEAEVKRLQNLIIETNNRKLKVQQDKLDKISKEIDGCSSAVTKAQVAIKAADRYGSRQGAPGEGSGLESGSPTSHVRLLGTFLGGICLAALRFHLDV